MLPDDSTRTKRLHESSKVSDKATSTIAALESHYVIECPRALMLPEETNGVLENLHSSNFLILRGSPEGGKIPSRVGLLVRETQIPRPCSKILKHQTKIVRADVVQAITDTGCDI